MALPLTKILCLGGGVAGITAVSCTVIYLNKKNNTAQKEIKQQQDAPENSLVKPAKEEQKTISDWLTTEGFELLKAEQDNEKWEENWDKFIKENTSDSLPEGWSFAGYSEKKTNKKSVPQEFKQKCLDNSKSLIKSKTEGQYEKVKLYCSKQKDAS